MEEERRELESRYLLSLTHINLRNFFKDGERHRSHFLSFISYRSHSIDYRLGHRHPASAGTMLKDTFLPDMNVRTNVRILLHSEVGNYNSHITNVL